MSTVNKLQQLDAKAIEPMTSNVSIWGCHADAGHDSSYSIAFC